MIPDTSGHHEGLECIVYGLLYSVKGVGGWGLKTSDWAPWGLECIEYGCEGVWGVGVENQ